MQQQQIETEDDRREKVGELKMSIKEIDRQLHILTLEKKRLVDLLVYYESLDVRRTLN